MGRERAIPSDRIGSEGGERWEGWNEMKWDLWSCISCSCCCCCLLVGEREKLSLSINQSINQSRWHRPFAAKYRRAAACPLSNQSNLD